MVTLQTFIQRVGTLESFLMKQSKHILVNESERITDMVREQHHDGKNADGETMQVGYSSGYTKKRKKKGLQTKYVDQHFSGRYHKALKVRPVEGGVDVLSDVEYEKYNRARFPKMVGLTLENAEAIAIILANILAPKAKKHLVK